MRAAAAGTFAGGSSLPGGRACSLASSQGSPRMHIRVSIFQTRTVRPRRVRSELCCRSQEEAGLGFEPTPVSPFPPFPRSHMWLQVRIAGITWRCF